ncbi:hypothetical protein [Spartinivicinus ruber]|uniref:hypothetical protein n=1 Tax=Spartinivicinus ruber TaxID=2683272 RepID=UPI0013D7895A|nr:hypothetical protein [Spartinivicinus ruber]
MRGLAEFIMRSPKHAAGVAAVSAIVPFTYWLSAATVALIILRRGWQSGSMILAWGLMPAVGLVVFRQDFSPLITILGASLLAVVLRRSMSWLLTLLVSILIGLAMMLVLLTFQADLLKTIADQLHQVLTQAGFYKQLDKQGGAAISQQFQALLLKVVAGANAWLHQLLAVAALMLARWWQSALYVPGGFHKELFQLRIPPKLAIAILLIVIVGMNINVGFATVLLIGLTPLFFSGLAMFHSIIALQSNSALGLAVFYLIQVVFAQVMFPFTVLVALLDSFIDFRRRMNKPIGR